VARNMEKLSSHSQIWRSRKFYRLNVLVPMLRFCSCTKTGRLDSWPSLGKPHICLTRKSTLFSSWTTLTSEDLQLCRPVAKLWLPSWEMAKLILTRKNSQ
jgi:hypothetical protein